MPKPEYISPPWDLPMQGLASISNRTLLSNEKRPIFFEEWDGPTNTNLKGVVGKVLRRVLQDQRLKYQEPRHDVASFLAPFLKVGDTQWFSQLQMLHS